MKRLWIGALSAVFLLGGCQEEPVPVQDVLVPPSLQRRKPAHIPAPEPTPADQKLIARVLKGEASFDQTARLQREMQIQDYLNQGDYARVDVLEKKLHAWPQEDPFQRRLEGFYRFCSRLPDERFKHWRKASPDTHVLHLAAAKSTLNRAYRVLITEPPERAGPQKIESLEGILKIARTHLEAAKADAKECPAYHSIAVELAILEGASREDVSRLLEASDKVTPGYLPAYAFAAIGRRPGWSGEVEAEDPLDLAQRLKAPQGLDEQLWKQARKAALAHHVWSEVASTLGKTPVTWEQYESSFRAALKLLPKSAIVRNRCAQTAWMHSQDQGEILELMASLGERCNLDYFETYFGRCAFGVPEQGKGVSLTPPIGIVDGLPISKRLKSRFFKKEVEALFLRARFPELEALGEEFLAAKSTELLKADQFWDPLSFKGETWKTKWELLFRLSKMWRDSYPDSVSARVCEARLWSELGWETRGHGFASTVSRADMEKFLDCQKKATIMYEEVLKASDSPVLKTYAGRCYLAGTPDKKRGFELLDQAMAQDLLHSGAVGAAANYLLPRWFGEPGDLGKLMAQVQELSPQEMGAAAKTEVIGTVISYRKSALFETEITWKEAKQAFEDRLKLGDSRVWVLNHYALAAYYANDKKTVKRVLAELGDDLNPRTIRPEVLAKMRAL